MENKDINILLLGETGVGKSTFVNAFINYLVFDTLDNAKDGDWQAPIPSKFKLAGDDGKPRTVEIGNSKERNVSGCKSYVFRNENTRIRLIDTPSMNSEVEIKKNFDSILKFASQYQHLNGICVFLKPNNSQLFSMQELLLHLHKGAKDNIVFCFTHTRPTFYHPGDAMNPLKEQLTNLKDEFKVEINLNQDTIYCFDNEPIRFLAAAKAGVKYEKGYEEFSESWRKSVRESLRLLRYLENCKPHKITDTLLINDIREIMIRLAKPLAEIGIRIQTNIGFLNDHLKEIENTAETVKDLIDNLYIKQLDYKTKTLNYPRTVCTSASCVQVTNINGADVINYITHCHKRCTLTGVESNVKKNPALQNCSAMNNDGTCTICGCEWDLHMHVDQELIPVHTKVIDKSVEIAINEKRSFQEQKKTAMESCLGKIVELKEEQKTITNINVKFVQFLKQSTISSFIDEYLEYLEHFIKEELIKKDANPMKFNDAVLKGLENAKKEYTERIRVIEKAIENDDNSIEVISPDDMSNIEQQLGELKHNGEALSKIKEEKAEKNVKHTSKNKEEKCYTFSKELEDLYSFVKEEHIKENDTDLKELEDVEEESTEKINIIKKEIENDSNSVETISPNDINSEQQLHKLEHNDGIMVEVKGYQMHLFEAFLVGSSLISLVLSFFVSTLDGINKH